MPSSQWNALDVLRMNQAPDASVESTPQGYTVSTGRAPTAAELEQMQLADIARQKRGIALQERLLENAYDRAQQNQQMDISPLLRLTDAWSGSHLSQNYTPPETTAQIRERLMNAQMQLQKSKDLTTDDQMNLLKAKLMGQQVAQSNALKEKLVNARVQQIQQKEDAPALSGEARNKVGSIMTALDSTNAVEKAYVSGSRPKYLDAQTPGVGAVMSDNPYTLAARKLKDDIGRMRSGGAITGGEETSFLNMLPRPADKEDVARAKLAQLRREFEVRLQGYGVNRGNMGKYGFNPADFGLTGEAPKNMMPKEAAPAAKNYEDMSDAELEALL